MVQFSATQISFFGDIFGCSESCFLMSTRLILLVSMLGMGFLTLLNNLFRTSVATANKPMFLTLLYLSKMLSDSFDVIGDPSVFGTI